MTPFIGQQAPQGQYGLNQGCQHEPPFMVQPVEQGPPQCGTFVGPTQLGTPGNQTHQDQGQGASWAPNCGQNPPMPFPPQQPHPQALSFSKCPPAVAQPQQVLPHFQPQTCPQQQQFPLPQAPGTAPVQITYLLNLYPFLTNNNYLLSQNLQLQLHYLPHVQNFKPQHQNLQAWTSKPWDIDLMLLWRKSLRTWLNLWSYLWHHRHTCPTSTYDKKYPGNSCTSIGGIYNKCSNTISTWWPTRKPTCWSTH